MTSPHVVVIGGGISGLAAAYQLSQRVPDVQLTVVEKSPSIGGKLATHVVGGLTLDAGAESVLARRPEALDLVAAVGLAGELVTPAQFGAGVWVDGRLRPLPASQLLGIPYDIEDIERSHILDASGVERLRGDEVLPPTSLDDDVSVGSIVRARMGQQVVERLVEPLLGGVYAGNADEISLDMAIPGLLEVLRAEGSLMAAIKAFRSQRSEGGPAFASLRGGLGRLPQAVADASTAQVLLNTAACAIRRRGGKWEVGTRRNGTDDTMSADAIVLACDGPAAGRLVSDMTPAAAAILTSIKYASVALITFVLDAASFPALPPGSGFLVPPEAHRLVKAATYVSQKWAWVARDYPEQVVVRASVGRFGESHVLGRSDDELARDALGELLPMIGADVPPVAWTVTRWEDSLPQYRVGHRARVEQIRREFAAWPGLELCGAAADGVGIPSCIASGRAAGTRVGKSLSERGE